MRTSAAAFAVAQGLFLLASTGCPGSSGDSSWSKAVEEIRALSESQDLATVSDFSDVSGLYVELSAAIGEDDDCDGLVESFGVEAQEAQQEAFARKSATLAESTALSVFSTLGALSDLRDAFEVMTPADAASLLGLEEATYLEILSDYSASLDDLIDRIAQEGLGDGTDWLVELKDGGKTASGQQLIGHELVHVVQQRRAEGTAFSPLIDGAIETIEVTSKLNAAYEAALRNYLEKKKIIHRDIAARFASVDACAAAADSTRGLVAALADETQARATVSNVLKTRHDTAKNAIGNIR